MNFERPDAGATTIVALERALLKGAAVEALSSCHLDASGVTDDRRFVVVEASGAQLYACNSPLLSPVRCTEAAGALTLTVPGEQEATAPIEHGVELSGIGWDRISRRGRVVEGPFATLLSEYLSRPVSLVDLRSWPARGVDVSPVTIVSRQSIAGLAEALGLEGLDHRRFRANIVVDAAAPHAEDEWIGCEVETGGVRLRVLGPIPRCAVITRDPDTGLRDCDALREVKRYRGMVTAADGSRGIPFGVYAEVVEGGVVDVGQALNLA